MLIKLLVATLVLAWVQLPVLKERTQSQLPPEWGTPLRAVLDSLDAAVGGPVASLWAKAAQGKAGVAEKLLVSASAVPGSPSVRAAAQEGAALTQPIAVSAPVPATAMATPGAASPPVAPGSTQPAAPSVAAPLPGAPAVSEATACVLRLDRNQPATIVMMGDSLMGNVAGSLQRWAAKHTVWQVVNAHKVSTGLANQEYYNWPKEAEALLTATPTPALAVMLVGTNDAQDIIEQRQRRRFTSEEWASAYQARMAQIARSADEAHVPLVWLGLLPVHNADFAKKIARIAAVQRAGMTGTTMHFMDVGNVLRDKEGNLKDKSEGAKPRALWAEDGTHLSAAGADLVVQALLPQLIGTDCAP